MSAHTDPLADCVVDDGLSADIVGIESGGGLRKHWPTANLPRTIPAIDNCEPEWALAIQDAIDAWNAAQPYLRFVYQPGTPGLVEHIDGAFVFHTTRGDYPHVAQVFPATRDGTIVYRARCIIRDSHYFDRAAGRDKYPYPARRERFSLIFHELGHGFVLPDTRPIPGVRGVEIGSQPMDTTCAASGCDDGTGPVGAWCLDLLAATYAAQDGGERRRKRRRRR